mgnify:CR=1 FL=1
MKKPPIIITENTITVMIGTKTHSIHKNNVNFLEVKRAIRDEKWSDLPEILDPVIKMKNFVKGKIAFQDGRFYYKDTEVHNTLTGKMMEMMKQGFPVDPMIKFMENMLENPSKRAVDELFGFMQTNALPITEDGHFIAYKKVREDYLDVHSGTLDNSVGNVVEMPRNLVDDNKDKTCSTGLHFCSIEYLKSFSGARLVILKINPRDVVSIPSDYHNTKGRACRYEVIGEQNLDGSDYKPFTKKAVLKAKRVQPRDKKGRVQRLKKKAAKKK